MKTESVVIGLLFGLMRDVSRIGLLMLSIFAFASYCSAANSLAVTPAATSILSSVAGTMTFRVDLVYEESLSACSFRLRAPAVGWTFGQVASSTFSLTNANSGTEPPAPVLITPQANDVPIGSEGFGFAFVTIPQSASSFTFTLKYASGLAGAQQFSVEPILVHKSGQKIVLNPAMIMIDAINTEGVFEADIISPGTVSLVDWVAVGRIVAGLDSAADGKTYAQADCAPRASLGDGRLTVSDWVQAGRYAAGLDPKTPIGGPTEPLPP